MRWLQSEESIKCDGPPAPREQEKEYRTPCQMLRPRVGIHERLNDRDHPKEWQRRHARRQTKDEQRRTTQLEGRRQKGRKLWGQYGDLVLIGEELDGELPTRRLRKASLHKHAGNGKTK